MILPILKYPNPILKEKSADIKDVKDPVIRELVFDMLETLENSVNGMGLAAPQIGKQLRISVIIHDRKKYVLINPVIISKSFSKEITDEGCLSFPGKFVPIKRSKKITVKFTDLKGKDILLKTEGLLARAFQHEIDHLDGVLLTDRARRKDKRKLEEET